jgi:2-iminobutanoate/2-iminopropanoate deaminase
MQIEHRSAPKAFVPTTGYSQASEAKGFTRMLCISGQVPMDAAGSVPEGFEAQARLAWKNVEAQLHAAGMTLDNLLIHRTFLADRKYTMQNRAIRRELFGDRAPACTVIICDLFDENWLIEIEATAAA